MSIGTAIVAIVAIIAFVKIVQMRAGIIKDRKGNEIYVGNNRQGNSDEALISEIETQNRELEDLRERVRVLERIATESNSLETQKTRQIAKEIEELRD